MSRGGAPLRPDFLGGFEDRFEEDKTDKTRQGKGRGKGGSLVVFWAVGFIVVGGLI